MVRGSAESVWETRGIVSAATRLDCANSVTSPANVRIARVRAGDEGRNPRPEPPLPRADRGGVDGVTWLVAGEVMPVDHFRKDEN